MTDEEYWRQFMAEGPQSARLESELLPRLSRLLGKLSGGSNPIPMVLHCPACGTQHIDAPEPAKGWDNPPHKSHLCHGCGAIWRPAGVPTAGVASLDRLGEHDTWKPGAATMGEKLDLAARECEQLRDEAISRGNRLEQAAKDQAVFDKLWRETCDHENDLKHDLDLYVERAKAAESRLPRWRIAASEPPGLEGEYIVARPRTGGGWEIDFDWFEPEATEFAHDDEAMNPGAIKVEFWMPCPEFPNQPAVVEIPEVNSKSRLKRLAVQRGESLDSVVERQEKKS